MTKPPDTKAADLELRRAEKREGLIRAALAKAGGVASPTMQAISRFFCRYAELPRPDLFLDTLAHIQRLQIMSLPEHRNGVGGAIAAVVSLHPEYQDEWRGKHKALIDSAERLAPPFVDEEISRPGQTEYIWMLWVVTRDAAALQRIVRLAHRLDSVGEAALSVLHRHAAYPEVSAILFQTLAARQARAVPRQQASPMSAAVLAVRELRAHLTEAAGGRDRNLVLVAWLKAESKPLKKLKKGEVPPVGSFVIATITGAIPMACPTQWKGYPVSVRKAKPDEVRTHKALIDAAEEP